MDAWNVCLEVFGYIVGMGESSAVKELLRYVEKANELDGDGDSNSLVKPTKTNAKKNQDKSLEKVDIKKEEKTVTQEVIPADNVQQINNDNIISFGNFETDNAFEINFFTGGNVDYDDSDFEKKNETISSNLVSVIDNNSGVVSNSSPVVEEMSQPVEIIQSDVVSTPVVEVAPVVSELTTISDVSNVPVEPAVGNVESNDTDNTNNVEINFF